ncbi:MAG TPA: tetratricopeptide repeat protein [bacterium]|nr:tetratricopeptide repeat protein [bacterium]
MKAFELYSTPGVELVLAEALMSEEKWSDALEHLIAIADRLKKIPTNSPVLTALTGTCLLRLKRDAEAVELFDQVDAPDEYDDFMHVLALKAEAYFDLRQYDKALAAVKTGLAKRSEVYVESKRDLRLWLAKIYAATGDRTKALGETRKILNEVPDYLPAKQFAKDLEVGSPSIT